MSIIYCDKHDRYVDTDFDECPQCEEEEVDTEPKTMEEMMDDDSADYQGDNE